MASLQFRSVSQIVLEMLAHLKTPSETHVAHQYFHPLSSILIHFPLWCCLSHGFKNYGFAFGSIINSVKHLSPMQKFFHALPCQIEIMLPIKPWSQHFLALCCSWTWSTKPFLKCTQCKKCGGLIKCNKRSINCWWAIVGAKIWAELRTHPKCIYWGMTGVFLDAMILLPPWYVYISLYRSTCQGLWQPWVKTLLLREFQEKKALVKIIYDTRNSNLINIF